MKIVVAHNFYMQARGDGRLDRPGRSLTFLVGGIGVAYVAVGSVIVWAYASANDGTHVRLLWDELPPRAPLLLPGLAILAAAGYVRHRRWATLLCAAIFAATAAFAGVVLVQRIGLYLAWPELAARDTTVLAIWLAALISGLRRLLAQWRWLGAASLPPGGFPVVVQTAQVQ